MVVVNLAGWQPRDGLTLLPDGWEQHNAAPLNGTRTADVEVWSGPADGEPEWVYTAGTETRNHGTLIASPTARIQRLLSEDEQPAGEQEVTTRRYLVALPRDLAEVTTRARIKVVDSGDAHLDGHYLSVADVQGGSLRLERHLICLDNLT